MKWETSCQADESILFVKAEGVMDKPSLLTMVRELVDLINRYGYRRCLIDYGNITAITMTTVDIYYLPRTYAEIGVPRNIKIATIAPKKFHDDFKFSETVDHNMGFQFSRFLERESALNWLRL